MNRKSLAMMLMVMACAHGMQGNDTGNKGQRKILSDSVNFEFDSQDQSNLVRNQTQSNLVGNQTQSNLVGNRNMNDSMLSKNSAYSTGGSKMGTKTMVNVPGQQNIMSRANTTQQIQDGSSHRVNAFVQPKNNANARYNTGGSKMGMPMASMPAMGMNITGGASNVLFDGNASQQIEAADWYGNRLAKNYNHDPIEGSAKPGLLSRIQKIVGRDQQQNPPQVRDRLQKQDMDMAMARDQQQNHPRLRDSFQQQHYQQVMDQLQKQDPRNLNRIQMQNMMREGQIQPASQMAQKTIKKIGQQDQPIGQNVQGHLKMKTRKNHLMEDIEGPEGLEGLMREVDGSDDSQVKIDTQNLDNNYDMDFGKKPGKVESSSLGSGRGKLSDDQHKQYERLNMKDLLNGMDQLGFFAEQQKDVVVNAADLQNVMTEFMRDVSKMAIIDSFKGTNKMLAGHKKETNEMLAGHKEELQRHKALMDQEKGLTEQQRKAKELAEKQLEKATKIKDYRQNKYDVLAGGVKGLRDMPPEQVTEKVEEILGHIENSDKKIEANQDLIKILEKYNQISGFTDNLAGHPEKSFLVEDEQIKESISNMFQDMNSRMLENQLVDLASQVHALTKSNDFSKENIQDKIEQVNALRRKFNVFKLAKERGSVKFGSMENKVYEALDEGFGLLFGKVKEYDAKYEPSMSYDNEVVDALLKEETIKDRKQRNLQDNKKMRDMINSLRGLSKGQRQIDNEGEEGEEDGEEEQQEPQVDHQKKSHNSQS